MPRSGTATVDYVNHQSVESWVLGTKPRFSAKAVYTIHYHTLSSPKKTLNVIISFYREAFFPLSVYSSESRICPTNLPTGQSDGGIFSRVVPSSQMTLAPVKLTKLTSTNPKSINL